MQREQHCILGNGMVELGWLPKVEAGMVLGNQFMQSSECLAKDLYWR